MINCTMPWKTLKAIWLTCSPADFYQLDYLSNPSSKRRSRGLSTRSNRSNSAAAPPSPTNTIRPSSPQLGRRKLNLAFVEDPLLAMAADNALSPIPQEPDPEPAPQLQANPPPVQTASVPPSLTHSRGSSVASNFSIQQDLSAFSKLSLDAHASADSAVGDLDIDRWDELEVDPQEPNTKFPYLVTHCKVYAIAEK